MACVASTAPPAVDPVDADSFYQELADRGLGYSGPFRSARGIGYDPTDPDLVYAQVQLPADTDITGYGIHPGLLDAALHPLAALYGSARLAADDTALRVPFAFSGSACTPPRQPSFRCG